MIWLFERNDYTVTVKPEICNFNVEPKFSISFDKGNLYCKVTPMTLVIAMTHLVTDLKFSMQIMFESCLMTIYRSRTHHI